MRINHAAQICALSAADLEDFVDDWLAQRCKDYHAHELWRGTGDMGRDVTGYVTDHRLEVSLPVGNAVVKRLALVLAEHQLPARLIAILERLHEHFKYLTEQIADIEKEMQRQLSEDALGQRLLTIRGVGPITASLLASELGDGNTSGRPVRFFMPDSA